MRFNCGPTRQEKEKIKAKKLEQWHKKFLWIPKRIDNQCIWLETVERKGDIKREWVTFQMCYASIWKWQYRLINKG